MLCARPRGSRSPEVSRDCAEIRTSLCSAPTRGSSSVREAGTWSAACEARDHPPSPDRPETGPRLARDWPRPAPARGVSSAPSRCLEPGVCERRLSVTRRRQGGLQRAARAHEGGRLRPSPQRLAGSHRVRQQVRGAAGRPRARGCGRQVFVRLGSSLASTRAI